MNFEESVSYIEGLSSLGVRPGLCRMKGLLAALGHPERGFLSVHVTGTNGKGSVVAMVAGVLDNASLRVGRFVSPHLLSYRERICVCGRNIPEEDFARAATVVREAAAACISEGMDPPTAFEVLSAMAFWYFKECGVDYAVVEVGMGGLLDSTNVLTPVVSVITNVAMDHEMFLGDTLEKIARQKAGIIKEGVPVVTAAQHVALKTVKKEAHVRKSRLYFYGRDFEIESRSRAEGGQVVCVRRKGMPKETEKALLFVPFVGAHQAVNAACALMALTVIMREDRRINENDVREGLARARWPGRFDVYRVEGKTVVLDGAHNPAGAEALKEALEEMYFDRRRLIVFASLIDKDTDTVIELLVRKEDKVFVTEAPVARTRRLADLSGMFGCEKKEEASVAAALSDAVAEAGSDDIVLVCGSLYILGEALVWIRERTAAGQPAE